MSFRNFFREKNNFQNNSSVISSQTYRELIKETAKEPPSKTFASGAVFDIFANTVHHLSKWLSQTI